MPRWISPRKLAERRETTISNIYRQAKLGILPPPVKLAPRCTRFDLDEVERREAQAIQESTTRRGPSRGDELVETRRAKRQANAVAR